jgi:hypothetical protein
MSRGRQVLHLPEILRWKPLFVVFAFVCSSSSGCFSLHARISSSNENDLQSRRVLKNVFVSCLAGEEDDA